MATGQIVTAYKDATHAHIAIRVQEASGAVEYIGSTPLVDAEGEAKANPVLKAECIADAKSKRDAQTPSKVELGLSGSVSL